MRRYDGLAIRAAANIARRHQCLVLDELIAAGRWGLVDAIRRFDPARGVAFHRYAPTRIYGAIMDSLRRADHLTRSRRLADRRAGRPSPRHVPLAAVAGKGRRHEHDDTEELLAMLPTRIHRLAVRLYAEGFTQGEVGRVCGVCESRISQLLAQVRRIWSERRGRRDG